MENAIELRHITKTFGKKVTANKDVSLEVRKGEILSLLGEIVTATKTLINIFAVLIYRTREKFS